MTDRPLYSLRTGLNPQRKLNVELATRMFTSVFEDFQRRDYFQELLGYWCVDNGDVAGIAGSDIGAFITRKTRKIDVWPIPKEFSHYTEDDLFDMIELMFRYVSKPISGRHHEYSNCGWHYSVVIVQEG